MHRPVVIIAVICFHAAELGGGCFVGCLLHDALGHGLHASFLMIPACLVPVILDDDSMFATLHMRIF